MASILDMLERQVGLTCDGTQRLHISFMLEESQCHGRELHR